MQNYHYDQNGLFTHTSPVQNDGVPINATRTKAPEKQGFWAVWNGKKWVETEDHRGDKYWLAEDSHTSEAREMEVLGALPDGALMEAPPAPPPTLEEKAAHLASTRWEAEQGGTVWNTKVIQTDDRSQSKYLAELAAIDQGVRVNPSPWKFESGFVMLSNEDIKTLSITARAHVMACFAAEAGVTPNLEALETFDAVAQGFKVALDTGKGAG